MSPRKAGATPEQIAAMLRAGATYEEIKRKLHVSSTTISHARTAHGIAPAWKPTRWLTQAEKIADAEQRYPQVITMLREGTTHREITAATGVTQHTITRVRLLLGIPARPQARRPRTIDQAIAHHLQPHGDGHARWSGPTAGNLPLLHAHGRRYNARREIFRAHHGRAPEGRIRRTCEQPGCMAIAHLADRILREQGQAEERLDDTFNAIFGDHTP